MWSSKNLIAWGTARKLQRFSILDVIWVSVGDLSHHPGKRIEPFWTVNGLCSCGPNTSDNRVLSLLARRGKLSSNAGAAANINIHCVDYPRSAFMTALAWERQSSTFLAQLRAVCLLPLSTLMPRFPKARPPSLSLLKRIGGSLASGRLLCQYFTGRKQTIPAHVKLTAL